MPQIYISALAATALAFVLWGTLFLFLSRQHSRLAWLALVSLPLSYLVNVFVKRPLAMWVSDLTSIPPVFAAGAPIWMLAFLHMLAPVTEEAAKLLPMLWPGVRARLTERTPALWAGMFAGAGFGIGEIWYLTYSLASHPLYTEAPWWQFAGFITERLLVVYVHAVLTAVAVVGIARRRPLQGLLAAVALHALVNVGGLLYQLGVIRAGQAQASLGLAVVGLAYIFETLLRPRERRPQ